LSQVEKSIIHHKVRTIAIYLPQFHPIPENDLWWGKGFTEWRNVVKAKPRFEGHYQPHLPADLGFYDLRLAETRQAQVDLAKKYGVYGFCYYHYWFNGRRILERPFTEVFESGKPDFPFMLCWANENWTRIWDGGEGSVLLEQKYSPEDDLKHINALIPYFKDERYIKIEGRPVFCIYKDSAFPDIQSTLQVFKGECAKHGINLYVCRFERARGTKADNPHGLGFDAAIDFQPLSRSYKDYRKSKKTTFKYLRYDKYLDFLKRKILKRKVERDSIIDLSEFVDFDIKRQYPNYKLFPGVSPGWDNSSRRVGRKATIFKNGTPEVFRKWIRNKLTHFTPYSREENFLFVNAWNEWAEGNHLEPCEKYGLAYLEILREELTACQQQMSAASS
jgi:lipopolysaccharide biosynthesis protein